MISGFLLYGWLPVVVALAVLLAAWLVVWWWTKWREGWVALIGLGLGPAAGLAYDIITASPFCPYGGRFSRPICSPLPSSAPAFALMFAGIALVGVLILLLTRPRGAA